MSDILVPFHCLGHRRQCASRDGGDIIAESLYSLMEKADSCIAAASGFSFCWVFPDRAMVDLHTAQSIGHMYETRAC